MSATVAGRFNPLDPEVLPDPYPTYRWLRENHPIYWDDGLQSWVVTRYSDCRRVLGDHQRFVSDWRRIGVQTPTVMHTLQSLDPPDFTRLHGFMTGAFKIVDYPQLARKIE